MVMKICSAGAWIGRFIRERSASSADYVIVYIPKSIPDRSRPAGFLPGEPGRTLDRWRIER